MLQQGPRSLAKNWALSNQPRLPTANPSTSSLKINGTLAPGPPQSADCFVAPLSQGIFVIGCFKAIGKKPLHYPIALFSTQSADISFYDGTDGKERVVSKNKMPASIGSNTLTVRFGNCKLLVAVSPSGLLGRIKDLNRRCISRDQINDRNSRRKRRFPHERNGIGEIQTLVIGCQVFIFCCIPILSS